MAEATCKKCGGVGHEAKGERCSDCGGRGWVYKAPAGTSGAWADVFKDRRDG